ncbi:MAG TPA: TonB family protein, partial [bacterium (Candidatus Stahlbacteria)]|nr:TonB family protein [Candidatus Stahlbacteria bacterium]
RLLKDIYLDEGELSTGPLPPSSWGFNKDLKPIPYNPTKATEILAKAGWKDLDYDRILERGRVRNEFQLTIIANRENPDRVQILNQVAEDLKRIGIRVNKEVVDIGTFIRRVIARDFDGMIMGWTVGDKIDPTIYWHSDPERGRYNFVGYKNNRIDSLIEAGLLSINIKKAIKIWNQFQQIIYDDQPYTFLVVPNEISAYHSRIQGVDAEIGADVPLAYTYWFEKKDQRIVKLEEEKVEERPGKPVEAVKKPTPTPPKPPETVTPEKILEEAAKRETAATKPAKVETVASEPFKPSKITRPKIINFVPAKYPPSLIDLGIEGTVVVKVLVGTDGRVKETIIQTSFGDVLCEREALAAARKATFKPATKDGVPYEAWVSLPFKFRPPEY